MEHINKALQSCIFPPLAINTLQNKFNCKHNSHNEHTNNSTTQQMDNNNSGSNSKNISIVVPHIHDLEERFKKTCNILGIQVYLRGTNTIKTLLMAPKDRDNKLQRSGVIYGFKCSHINFLEEYIRESGRSFMDWIKEHLRAPSPIHQHSHSTDTQ